MASPSITTTPSTLPAACTFSTDDNLISGKAGSLVEARVGKWGQVFMVVYNDSNGAQQTAAIKNPSNIALT